MNDEKEMPKYRSHKVVWALKIAEIKLDSELAAEEKRETTGGAKVYPSDMTYNSFHVDHEYVRKHNPQAGGYYVVYEGGYASWSPADAFEKGNTLINTSSLGYQRVNATFNPSGLDTVDVIKMKAAELIDLIDSLKEDGNGERNRCCALAQTEVETAAMYAVKANFK